MYLQNSPPPHLVSVSTDKDHYQIGDIVTISGTVSERAYLPGYNYIQTPLNIIVQSNWDANIRIYIDGNLGFTNSFSLSPQVGFEEGLYKLSVEYNNSTYNSTFSVGDRYRQAEYEKTELVIPEPEIKEPKKIFNMKSDKEKYATGDRALFTGFMENYKTASFYDSPSVGIQILDENMHLLESKYYGQKTSAVPSLYGFNVFPRTGTGYAINQDIGFDNLKRLEPGEFRFSVSITPLDFIENKTYYAVASYAKEQVTVPFTVYDKFAHMTDIFEIYLEDTFFSLGDTVTITGLAPHATGGSSQSKTIVGFDSDKNPIIKRSSSSPDNSYVFYTIKLPNGEKETGQVNVDSGEFTIDYEISKYPKTTSQVENYSIEVEWSNNVQYLQFHVKK